MSSYGKCRKNVDISKENVKIVCDTCRTFFHEDCSGLTSTEKRCIPLQNRNLMFLCLTCREGLKSLPLLMQQLTALNEEITKLRNEIIALKDQRNCTQHNPEEVLAEIEERINRSNNVIIYNINESMAENISQKISDDKNIVQDILQDTGVSFEINKVVRVGKKQPNNGENKNRPVKVIFSSASTAKKILKNKNKIRAKEYRIANDFTPNQMKYMKDLRNELAQRVANGENLTIRYINGIPKIAAPKSKN